MYLQLIIRTSYIQEASVMKHRVLSLLAALMIAGTTGIICEEIPTIARQPYASAITAAPANCAKVLAAMDEMSPAQ